MIDSLIDMGTAMMDLYALARMFRTKWKDGAPPPRNIIVYVGDYHADVYRGFLKKLGFHREDAIVPGEKDELQCVQVLDDKWFDQKDHKDHKKAKDDKEKEDQPNKTQKAKK